MAIETNRQPYYSMQDSFNPEWWEKWLKKNWKKQKSLLLKRIK
jgi:hypothetical protein